MLQSTWLHLRIPFSFYLMPVYLFAISLSVDLILWKAGLVFFILHFLLYPASNGFNSYYDKDEDSIGGLEHPPPVSRELLYASLALDGLALLLGALLGWVFVAGLFVYGLVSKAYSYDRIRLKKYAVLSWVLASVFQGAFTFLMVYQAVNEWPVSQLLIPQILYPAALTTLLLMGFYPMTQVYQHAEDARRGDMTMSRLLGIRGTFVFTAGVFGLGAACFLLYFSHYFDLWYFGLFLLCLAPGLVYFFWWFARVVRIPTAANFRSTMRLNLLSSMGTNVFFVLFGWLLR